MAKSTFFSLQFNPWRLVLTASVGCCLATVGGFFGQYHWALDLFSNFRAQYTGILLVLGLVYILASRPRPGLCWLGFALVNAATILPLYQSDREEILGPGISIRALLLNVNSDTGDPNQVRDALSHYKPDIVALEEISSRWVGLLDSLKADYSWTVVEPRDDNFGIALLSKLPMTQTRTLYLSDAEVPSLQANIQTTSGELEVLATHPLPPAGRSYSHSRNLQLRNIAKLASETKLPLLVLGDLNTTVWSPHFTQLLTEGRLLNSSRGRGILPTWPTKNPFFWIEIDHCLHSADIGIQDKFIGGPVGSDHYPVIVDFSMLQLARN